VQAGSRRPAPACQLFVIRSSSLPPEPVLCCRRAAKGAAMHGLSLLLIGSLLLAGCVSVPGVQPPTAIPGPTPEPLAPVTAPPQGRYLFVEFWRTTSGTGRLPAGNVDFPGYTFDPATGLLTPGAHRNSVLCGGISVGVHLVPGATIVALRAARCASTARQARRPTAQRAPARQTARPSSQPDPRRPRRAPARRCRRGCCC